MGQDDARDEDIFGRIFNLFRRNLDRVWFHPALKIEGTRFSSP